MAKKLVAVTGIKHNGKFYSAGEALDPTAFTKDALKELHDNGALRVEDDSTPEDVKASAETSKETKEAPEAPKVTPEETLVPKVTETATPKK